MTAESLPRLQACAGQPLLAQYMITCPTCRKPSAAHVDRDDCGERVLVRFVCPDACTVSEAAVLAVLPPDTVPLTA